RAPGADLRDEHRPREPTSAAPRRTSTERGAHRPLEPRRRASNARRACPDAAHEDATATLAARRTGLRGLAGEHAAQDHLEDPAVEEVLDLGRAVDAHDRRE